MKLPFATVRASSDAAAPHEKAVREARVTAARRVGWEELPADRLIPRGRLLVDAESDHTFTVYLGAIFERGSARLISEQPGLAFYVDEDSSPVVLERGRETWSQIYARQARREARR